MKRLITTLAILLVVIVAGMTALVLLVNPNDFRAYMAHQVEQRSGYQLALKGELRWHVWPQLSILSGPVTLTAQGASQPVVSAENMRLDVNLLPLLSHQLSVKQVMLKNAVVRLIPESERQRPADAPIGPEGSSPPSVIEDVTRGWRFDISHLRIVDSLLVWQQDNGEQLNVRDFNLRLDQTQPRLVNLEFSSRISRDQRDLRLQFSSELDITHYPRQINAAIKQLDYQLQGADLPQTGIKGQAAMAASWDNANQRFSLSDIQLSANDSQLSGTITGSLGNRPQVVADLSSATLNMDSLLGIPETTNADAAQQSQRTGRAPVIAESAPVNNADSPLNAVDGKIGLKIAKLRWRGIDMDAVDLEATNQQGLLSLVRLQGQADGGTFSLPGSIDVRSSQTRVALKPSFQRVGIGPLLKAFNLPDTISGELSLDGDFNGNGLTVAEFNHQWQGSADLKLDNAQFAGLNFQQLIQRAVEGNSDKVRGERNDQPILQQISGHATLNNGLVTFPELKAQSTILNYTGSGNVDLAKRELDINFGVTVMRGWQGDDTLVRRLQQTPVPLRIYGPWSTINYSLKVDQVLRQQLRDEAKQRLKEWMGRNPENEKRNDVKKLLKDM
ncbi:outer membrane assembly protein AsmA [Pantoea coffeiphila]|uniref:Outer membrane assembly protein AsmA n=1 Tax=Pantoea coffeiphila TaxID=1465635 RepID=A0A2S9IGA3_9GAMM|nr:outer membrane assembly protein AsmA [Pantoea coffeiphila]PRD16826.1 outer membrane assembly protein AsmA [Pantoea coffeiphila]